MKQQMAKEYLNYSKKHFTEKKKKFGNLGSDVLNYIKEKKQSNPDDKR